MRLAPNIEERHLRLAIKRRRRSAVAAPIVTGVVVFLVCIAGCVRFSKTEAGEQVAGAVMRLGETAAFSFILMGLGLASVLAVAATMTVERHLIRAEIRRCSRHPCCVWCEHSLHGHRHGVATWITCPECGRASPVDVELT